jgi:hypothetical protein
MPFKKGHINLSEKMKFKKHKSYAFYFPKTLGLKRCARSVRVCLSWITARRARKKENTQREHLQCTR